VDFPENRLSILSLIHIPRAGYPGILQLTATLRKALALNDTDSRCQTAISVVYLYSGNHDQAHFRLAKALALNPGDARALTYMSRYEMFLGNSDRSIELIDQARHYDPYGIYDWSLATAHFVARNYDAAINLMRSLQNPALMMAIYMAAIYAQAGEVENASEIAAKNIDLAKAKLISTGTPLPESWLNFVSQRMPFKHKKDREHFLQGLRIAGVPE